MIELKEKKRKTIIISESQLNRIKLTEMMDTRMEFPKMGITVDDVLTNIVQCGGYDGLYPGSDDDTEDGDGFYPFDNKEEMLTNVYRVCYDFEQFEDPFLVWRSVRVDKLDDITYGDLIGNSWSFEQESAMRFSESMWGNTGNTLLKAECPFSAVDWVETISRYIQDNTEGGNFNSGFSENEIYVEIPGRLESVQVEGANLAESVDYINKLITEANQIPFAEQQPGSIYVFKYDPNGTPSYLDNFDHSSINKDDKTGTVEEFFDADNNLLCYHQKSKQIPRKTTSEYYQTPPHDGKKFVTRGADHWSYILIPNYMYYDEEVTLVLTDCGVRARELTYNLLIPSEYGRTVKNSTINNILNKDSSRKFEVGKKYIQLSENILKRDVDFPGICKHIYGYTYIDASDKSIFPNIIESKTNTI